MFTPTTPITAVLDARIRDSSDDASSWLHRTTIAHHGTFYLVAVTRPNGDKLSAAEQERVNAILRG